MSEYRDRVGLSVQAENAAKGLEKVVYAESVGVKQLWMTSLSIGGCDTLSFCCVAAAKTQAIKLGTSILQIYTRHPLVTAQQALTFWDLAPGRLRLGIGTSHRSTMEGRFGISLVSPLGYLREYASVLRSALWEGKVEHRGKHFKVSMSFTRKAQVPVLFAALGPNAFRVAGELSDGAISWMCPKEYLLKRAIPEMEAGARHAKRTRPPLVAHVLVSLNQDEKAVHEAAVKTVRQYGALPFYQNMFKEAGYDITQESAVHELAHSLTISGSEQKVRERIIDLLSEGIDELLLMQLQTTENETEWKRLSQLVGCL
jgi:F420-dependent oxidoreductase-like protein